MMPSHLWHPDNLERTGTPSMMKLVLCGILSACGIAIALAGAAQADPIKLRIGYGGRRPRNSSGVPEGERGCDQGVAGIPQRRDEILFGKAAGSPANPPRQLMVRVPADVFLNMSDYYRGHDRLNEL
jgi:hypothetical protein